MCNYSALLTCSKKAFVFYSKCVTITHFVDTCDFDVDQLAATYDFLLDFHCT